MLTPVKINNSAAKRLKVLVAPLDWGLGHVTRCIPIIKELINQKCVVIAAVSGVQKAVLYREIPDLDYVELPGYNVKYGKNRTLTVLQLISSIPKILIRVNRENAWLRHWVDRERPDLIISDNRYGLYSPEVLSIFITHQLLIRTPFGPGVDRLLQRMNYSFIRRFSLCWVPDVEGPDGLAGELSHPVKMPGVPIRYIGWLSRFGEAEAGGLGAGEIAGGATEPEPAPFDLLVLLSGPEPQRGLLEKKILEQIADYPGRVVLVRGLPGGADLQAPPRVKIYDHLPAAGLGVLIRGADQIITRSGYSTVMDLMRLGKRAILIPTPGQTEQEYLGDYLAAKGWAICIKQDGFCLRDALALASGVLGDVASPGSEKGAGLLKQEITAVLERIRGGEGDLAG